MKTIIITETESWTKVTDKLPAKIKYHKSSEWVIATDGTKSYFAYFGYGSNSWYCFPHIDNSKIIAWMPLPSYGVHHYNAWATFKKLCKSRGWAYQTLSNQKKVPKVGNQVGINGETVLRLKIN